MWTFAFPSALPPLQASSEKEDILRQFGRYCPEEAGYLEGLDVWIAAHVVWKEYRFVRILIPAERNGGRVVYGFYAPGDFRPLDQKGTAIAEIYRSDELQDADMVQEAEFVAAWATYVKAPARENLSFPNRVQAAIPMWDWQHTQEFGMDIAAVIHPNSLDLSGTVMRFARLPFYASWRLLEYAGLNGNGILCRAYALCRVGTEGPKIIPLTGKSDGIHQANDEAGELLLNTQEQRKEYLRFFCWAIESDMGNFLLPRYRRELNLTKRLQPDVASLIPLEITIDELGEEADGEAAEHGYPSMGDDRHFGRLRSLVFHGSAAFKAWFKLERTGAVSMQDDSPIAADLPFEPERFGSERLLVLQAEGTERNKSKDDAPALPAEAQITSTSPPGPNVRYYGHHFPTALVLRPMEDEDFLEQFRTGSIAGVRVGASLKMAIKASAYTGPRSILVEDCHFTHQVDLDEFPPGVSLHFKNCLFDQGVNARLLRMGGDLYFTDCSIARLPNSQSWFFSVDLSQGHVEGTLLLVNCHSYNTFNGDGAEVDGNLLIWGCYFGGAFPEREAHWDLRSLHQEEEKLLAKDQPFAVPEGRPEPKGYAPVLLNNAEIHGNLEVMAVPDNYQWATSGTASSWGSTDRIICTVGSAGIIAQGCTVDHKIHLAGSVWHGHLILTGLHCKGDLLSSVRCPRPAPEADLLFGFRIWNGALWLDKASLDADVALTATDVLRSKMEYGAYVDMRGTNIGGRLDLAGTRVTGDFFLDFCTIDDYLNAYHTLGLDLGQRQGLHIGEDLSLSGARIGIIELRGVRIGRLLRAISGTFGRVLITPGIERNSTDSILTPSNSQVGAIEFLQVCFKGSLELVNLQIKPADHAQAQLSRIQSECGVKIIGCTIEGDLLFFDEELTARLERRWNDKAVQAATWQRKATKIADAGNRERAGQKSEPLSTTDMMGTVWGHLDLASTSIGGHLDLRNLAVDKEIRLNDVHVKLDLRMDHGYLWRAAIKERWEGLPRTSCYELNAEKLRCDGDVLMTGLTVGVKNDKRTEPLLRAREATVRGEWLFMPINTAERSTAPGSATMATIHGGVDLAAASINHLIIGKDNFILHAPTHNTSQPRKVVDLERACIQRFEIVKPMPSTVDLSRIKVGRWEFNAGTATADDFLEVLQDMYPFDRTVWVDVERSFRNEARDEDANKVYRGMRRAAARSKDPVTAGNMDRIGDLISNFVQALTWPLLLLLIGVAYFILWPIVLVLSFINWLLPPAQQIIRPITLSIRNLMQRTKVLVEGWVTAYGTQVWRPMVLWILLFATSAWLLKEPANVELDLGSRTVLVKDNVILGPDPLQGTRLEVVAVGDSGTVSDRGFPALLQLRRDQVACDDPWSWGDALLLTIRYHVPVLDLDYLSEWKAGQRTIPCGPLTITPEKWTALAQAYSFVAWTLFLIGLSVTVFRGKQQ